MQALCNPNISSDELAREIERSKAAAAVAGQMVRNSNTIINAKKMVGTLDVTTVNSIVSGES
jgi:hypothetical protein